MKAKDQYLSLLRQARDAEKRDNSLDVTVEVAGMKGGQSRFLSVYSRDVRKCPYVFMASYFEAEPFSKMRSSIRIWAKTAGGKETISGAKAIDCFRSLIGAT